MDNKRWTVVFRTGGQERFTWRRAEPVAEELLKQIRQEQRKGAR
jgi:hypothetical protein